MRRAVALASEAAIDGEVPVGAVLLTGDLRFEARNEKERRADPTAHAEMLVIRAAAAALGAWRIGGTLYVTKEPCAMCAGAIGAARIERLVFGCSDPKGGAAGSVIDVLRCAALNHHVDVTGGILEPETAAALRQFFQSRRTAQTSGRLGKGEIRTPGSREGTPDFESGAIGHSATFPAESPHS